MLEHLAAVILTAAYFIARLRAKGRFQIMAEAITVVDTDQVGIVYNGVDKQGIKTGAILSGLTLAADQPALVAIAGPSASGLFTVSLNAESTPIAGPVVVNITATDSATNATDTTAITFNAGPAVSISATVTDIPPA
jgi:hypothetical protein